MPGFIECCSCRKRIAHNAKSLPEGQAMCHPCRRLTPKLKREYKPKVACAGGCGNLLFIGRGSLPSPTCRECRAVARQARRAVTCEWCGQTVEKQHAQPTRFCSRVCANKSGTVRSSDDRRVTRLLREQAAPGLSAYQRSKLLGRWKRQGRTCAYCPALAASVDHALPLVLGGTNFEGNLVPCCRSCNSAKRALTIIEWRSGLRLMTPRERQAAA